MLLYLCSLICTFFQFAGLSHLHTLSPRLVHKDFKTSNVLVDENFIAKVADAGVRNFLGRVDDTAGPSSQKAVDEMFLAPEYVILHQIPHVFFLLKLTLIHSYIYIILLV